jgi:Tfp pilus assembly protein PilO
MIRWWHQTPIWQRFMIFGLAMVLFVLGMHAWVWSSLDSSIAKLDQDIVHLTQKNLEAIKSIALLRDVEQEVAILREKLSPRIQHLPVRVEPQAFRKDVVDIGKRTGVAVRLWKPKKSLMKGDQSDIPLDIVVRVEGRFYSTVQFLNELLQLSWIQTVNPLVLVRKQGTSNSPTVTTDFTIEVFVARGIQQVKEKLET